VPTARFWKINNLRYGERESPAENHRLWCTSAMPAEVVADSLVWVHDIEVDEKEYSLL
jgi:hypothetical protein